MKNSLILLLTLFCFNIFSQNCNSESRFDKYKKENIEKNKQENINPVNNYKAKEKIETTENVVKEEKIDSSQMTPFSYFWNSLTFTIIFGVVGARNLVYFLVLALLFIVMFQCILDIVLMGIFFGVPLSIIIRKVFKC
ncbi:MAG: hypothetical protein WC942_11535 [Clostridia bacterium]|jgi:hypothetical protein